MEIFQAIKDSDLQCQVFGNIHLEKYKSYYSFSKLAQDLSKLNIAVLNGYRAPIPDFDKENLLQSGEMKKVLLIHSGGYGDTITVGMLLPLLEKKFEIFIDVSCHYDKWEYILKPMGFKGKWIPYPIELGTVGGYDCVLTEIIKYVTEPTRLLFESPLEVVAESFELSLSNIQPKFEVPEEIKRSNRFPEKNAIRIGLNFDSMGSVKSYPKNLQPVLVHSLKALGFEIFFLGMKSLSPDIDLTYSRLHDLTGKTSIPELTALLEQMDIIIGVDSFVSHLAAVIGKPTLGLAHK